MSRFCLCLAALAALATPVSAACPPRFSDHPVAVHSGTKLKPPVLATAEQRRYRTMIRTQTATSRIDFAGRYSIALWGCGTMCQRGAAVDRRTGRILMLPEARLGFSYRPSSRLLVINPPAAIAEEVDAAARGLRTHYLLLEQGGLKPVCAR